VEALPHDVTIVPRIYQMCLYAFSKHSIFVDSLISVGQAVLKNTWKTFCLSVRVTK